MKRLLLSLMLPLCASGMQLIEREQVSTPLDTIKLYSNNEHIYVEDEHAFHRVQPEQMNKELRTILQHKALEKFKGAGYIRVTKGSMDKYALAAQVRGLGGGAAGAYWAYSLTKGGLYALLATTATATVTAAVVASGGGVAVAGGGAMAAEAIGFTMGAAAGVTAPVAVASAGVAGSVTAVAGTTTVAMAASSVAASTGSAAGVMAAIEGASLFVGALFAGPWCP